MKRVQLAIDTLACEADESIVLDELLAQEGVLAAELDFEAERLSVAYDEKVTTKSAVVDFLRFFGIAPVTRPLAAR